MAGSMKRSAAYRHMRVDGMSRTIEVTRGVLATLVTAILILVGVAGWALLSSDEPSGSAPPASGETATKADPGPETHTLRGEMVVTDVEGAVVPLAGGFVGGTFADLEVAQMTKAWNIMTKLEEGHTFDCPDGAGGGYEDLKAGAEVVVTGTSHEVLAVTRLEGGELSGDGCTFAFEVEVPDSDFYNVEVTHRGEISYSASDLDRDGWFVSLEV